MNFITKRLYEIAYRAGMLVEPGETETKSDNALRMEMAPPTSAARIVSGVKNRN